MNASLLDEFPDLAAAWDAKRHPVVDILCGKPAEPSTFDDLPKEIRLAVDVMRDPWCPRRFHPALKTFVEKATALLEEVRRAQ